jgi:hypothetical protein
MAPLAGSLTRTPASTARRGPSPEPNWLTREREMNRTAPPNGCTLALFGRQ